MAEQYSRSSLFFLAGGKMTLCLIYVVSSTAVKFHGQLIIDCIYFRCMRFAVGTAWEARQPFMEYVYLIQPALVQMCTLTTTAITAEHEP